MDSAVPFLIFGFFILFVIVVVVFGIISSRKRRKALAELAVRLGLNFNPDTDYELAKRFAFLNRLARGTNRYAYNVLSGRYSGHEVLVFDYHYETHSKDAEGKSQTSHYHFSFFILMLRRPFPELLIIKEGWMSKIAQAFGYDDIDFESAEFSRLFCVRSKDKRFAYDFCNPQMIEYLLENRDLAIEVEGQALAIGFDSCLNVDQIERNLGRLVQLRSLLPEYLFTNPV